MYKNKNFELSEDVAAQAFLKANKDEYDQFYILICVIYAKSYFKMNKIQNCLEILEHKYVERPTHEVLIYYYGKFAAKSLNVNCRAAAISALEESVKQSNLYRYGNIYYWLSKAYLLNNQTYESYRCMQNALQFLHKIQSKKTQEMTKKMTELKPKIDIIENINQSVSSKLSLQDAEKLKTMCEQLKNFQKGYYEIYISKVFWSINDEDSAISYTEEACKSKTVNYKAYKTLFFYLKKSKNMTLIKNHSKEMISKCRSSNMPLSI